MNKRTAERLWQVDADHEGWEADVELMDASVGSLFKNAKHCLQRYVVVGYDGRTIAVGYESSSVPVLKRARKLGWLE